jgi:hypothetical protein
MEVSHGQSEGETETVCEEGAGAADAAIARVSFDSTDKSVCATLAQPMPEIDVAQTLLSVLRLDCDRSDYERLIAIGQSAKELWERRRLAALLLEIEFLCLDDDTQIRFLAALGADIQPEEARRRLVRFDYIRRGSSDDLLAHAESECHLLFARYLFTPREVVKRIVSQLRITEGRSGMRRFKLPEQHPWNMAEARRTLRGLPPYERAIVRELMRDWRIYWVDAGTPSRIGSLVEFPLGTVALVIKPPGSSHEIEIKRCGVRGPRAVEVRRFNARGERLPKQHQFYGASMGDCLLWEWGGGSMLSRYFRKVHGAEAPMSQVVSVAKVRALPGMLGPVAPRTYFEEREDYGDGFDEMRIDLRHVVKDFTKKDRSEEELVDALIVSTDPAQAIVTGTTSFRLDVLAGYLAPEGATRYFAALGVSHTDDDDRRFADAILGEAIDDYEPPRVPYQSYTQYLDAAHETNRRAADETYASVFAQIGRFWGTAMAARVYSSGESFAARNTGLRRIWNGEHWRVTWFSMDHDSLQMIGRKYRHFHPHPDVNGMIQDQAHILGGPLGRFIVKGELQALKAIYCPDAEAASRGFAAFRTALKESYTHAHRAIREDPAVSRLFHREFVETLHEWDEALGDFIDVRHDPEQLRKWQDRTRARLIRHGIPSRIARQYVLVALDMIDLLPWFGGLYARPKRRRSSA